MSNHIIDDILPMEDTLCKTCIHRFSKLVVPIDYEMYGINLDDYDIPEGEELKLERHVCLITQEDIDSVVLNCNRFEDGKKEGRSFFTRIPY